MTGLYSETQDDSSGDLPQDTESDSLPSTITVTTNFEPVLTQSVTVSTTLTNPALTTTSITSAVVPDTVIKCHSRQPSSSLMDREKTLHNEDLEDDDLSKDCGILSCRPAKMQKLARIRVGHGHDCILTRKSHWIPSAFSRFSSYFSPCSWHCSKRWALVT